MEIIIGAAISLFIQWVKNVAKLGEYQTLATVLVLSVVAATVYSYLLSTGLWDSFQTVLLTSGAFYTFIIQRFVK